MLKKLLRRIKSFLPVSQRAYEETTKNLILVLNGLTQAEKQHSQLELNFAKEIQSLKGLNKPLESNNDDKKNINGYA